MTTFDYVVLFVSGWAIFAALLALPFLFAIHRKPTINQYMELTPEELDRLHRSHAERCLDRTISDDEWIKHKAFCELRNVNHYHYIEPSRHYHTPDYKKCYDVGAPSADQMEYQKLKNWMIIAQWETGIRVKRII